MTCLALNCCPKTDATGSLNFWAVFLRNGDVSCHRSAVAENNLRLVSHVGETMRLC